MGSIPAGGAKKRLRLRKRFFIQSEGLVWKYDAVVHGIAEGVWNHGASLCPLRIDSIHHFMMIPYDAKAPIPYTASP